MAATLILLLCLLPHDVNKKRIFTIFIVMSGWLLLPSATVQYQSKIKLAAKLPKSARKLRFGQFTEENLNGKLQFFCSVGFLRLRPIAFCKKVV